MAIRVRRGAKEREEIPDFSARQDEIGTPYCFTIDDQTVADQTVTVRERNTMAQERISLDNVSEYLRKNIKAV